MGEQEEEEDYKGKKKVGDNTEEKTKKKAQEGNIRCRGEEKIKRCRPFLSLFPQKNTMFYDF